MANELASHDAFHLEPMNKRSSFTFGPLHRLSSLGADGKSAGEPLGVIETMAGSDVIECFPEEADRRSLFTIEADPPSGRRVVLTRGGKIGTIEREGDSAWRVIDATGQSVAVIEPARTPPTREDVPFLVLRAIGLFLQLGDPGPDPPSRFTIRLGEHDVGRLETCTSGARRACLTVSGDVERRIDRRLAAATLVATCIP